MIKVSKRVKMRRVVFLIYLLVKFSFVSSYRMFRILYYFFFLVFG